MLLLTCDLFSYVIFFISKQLLWELFFRISNSKVPVISFANGSLLEYLEKYVQEEKDRIALITTRANVTDTYMFSCGLFLQAGEISTVIMVNYQNSEVSINSRSREGNWKAWKKL